MRRVLAILLILALSATSMLLMAQEEKVFPYNYHKVELENGFKAYLIKAGAPGQIIYVTMVRTGSRDEWEDGMSGFAHFFEHVMFRGTEKYPQYDALTSEWGAARNAFTSNDMTVYYMLASNRFLENIIDLESDRFMNLKYNESDFKTESGAILGEYQQSKFSPFGYLNTRVRDLAFQEHTYKHTTIGFEDDIRAMPEGYEYSISFFNRYYRPENCVLVLAGDFDVANAEALVRQYYADWTTGYVAPQITPEPVQTAAIEEVYDYPGRTLPIININYKSPAWEATGKLPVALEVLGEVAFGSNSEIYRKLVLDEQKVQYIAGNFGLARDPSLASISSMVKDPADIDYVKAEIYATIEKFKTDLADEKLLADTKSSMKYGFLMGLETAQNIAFSMIQVVINTGGIEAIEDYYKTLDNVTAEDLREAAAKWLIDTSRTEVVMVQAGGAK
jgi:zinc protease